VVTNLDLPIIDLQDLLSDDRREQAVQALGVSLETFGFVAVEGHGISHRLLDETYALASAFFARPQAEKALLERPETGRQRGYTGFGIERAKDHAVADLKEFYQLGRPVTDPDSALHPNVDPLLPEDFGPTLDTLFEALDQFGQVLLHAIAAYLGLPEGYFAQAVTQGNSVLRVIHYPPVTSGRSTGGIRAAAHEDINLLTVLPSSTQPGLELIDRETGVWHAINVPPHVMLCDTGDIMQRLTQGRLPATTHRVVNPAGSSNVARYSLPYFMHPHPDWVIRPMAGDAPPITAGAFLRERLIANGVLEA
jgi:isopenicillin N synthase-like dioxygenase